jgi:hypothetical protein
MVSPVAGQKRQGAITQFSQVNGVAGRTKRCIHNDLADIREQIIKSAPSDNSNVRSISQPILPQQP